MDHHRIAIYTDGAARGNPGKGGYGIVLMYGKHYKEQSAAYRLTTNNRMELLAVIEGITMIKSDDIPIDLYTDSRYVSDAINKGWLKNWEKKNFKNKKNPDLWKRLIPLLHKQKVTFHWVKGHAENTHNNKCDELATEAADRGPYLVDEYYEDHNSD